MTWQVSFGPSSFELFSCVFTRCRSSRIGSKWDRVYSLRGQKLSFHATDSAHRSVETQNRCCQPHPKDGEGNVFSLTTTGRGGGYPSPRFFPRSLVPGPFGMGYPLARSGWGNPPPPRTEQQSEHLLRGGRYASWVHAGRLSCFVADYVFFIKYHSNIEEVSKSQCVHGDVQAALKETSVRDILTYQDVHILPCDIVMILPRLFIVRYNHVYLNINMKQFCTKCWDTSYYFMCNHGYYGTNG